MKYLKSYEEKSKGKEVVYTFKNKAKSDKYEYTVHLLQSESKYDETNGHSYNGLVISIDDTPASWYVSTFLHYNPNDYSDYTVIDGGSNWTVTNMLNIRRELKEWLKNEYPVYQNIKKYNI